MGLFELVRQVGRRAGTGDMKRIEGTATRAASSHSPRKAVIRNAFIMQGARMHGRELAGSKSDETGITVFKGCNPENGNWHE
jgi:hypothetical protein